MSSGSKVHPFASRIITKALVYQIKQESIYIGTNFTLAKLEFLFFFLYLCRRQVDKKSAEKKLEVAGPALEEAEAALQTIKPAHVASVRKLQKPPHLIMRIMDCALILFRKRVDPVSIDPEKNCVKTSWSESLRLMSQSGFLQSLMTFPKVCASLLCFT